MTRERDAWLEPLRRRLTTAFPTEVWNRLPLARTEVLNAELVLHFMTTYFPGVDSVNAPALLDGYRVPARTASDDLIAGARRRVLLLLGHNAPTQRLMSLLERYRDVAESDDPYGVAGRLCLWRFNGDQLARNDYAEFAALRTELYEETLTSPIPYRTWSDNVADPGAYEFLSVGGRRERVLIPPRPSAHSIPAVAPLSPVAKRTRQPFTVSWAELAAAAAAIDEAVPDEAFATRFGELRLQSVDEGGQMSTVDELTIDGLVHAAGLMTAGKTTLLTLLAVVAAQRGLRVLICTDTVAGVLNLMRLLERVGIPAAPVIGAHSRARHSQGVYERAGEDLAAAADAGADIHFGSMAETAAWVADTCLLEPYREESGTAEPRPLTPSQFPCRKLRRDGDVDGRMVSCPLRNVCPVHLAERTVPTASVWVTTPQALLQVEVGPLASTHRMRWLEFAQHHADLLLVDEADRLLGLWDHTFMPSQDLQDSDDGWVGVSRPIDLGKAEHPARWHTTDRGKGIVRRAARASRALDELLHRFYGSEGSRAVIRNLENKVWNDQSLLWDMAQVLHGIEPKTESPPEVIEATRQLYIEELALLTSGNNGKEGRGSPLELVRAGLLNDVPEERLIELLAKWAETAVGDPVPDESLRRALSLLGLALWASEFSENSRFVVDHSAALLGEEFGIDLPDWGLAQARAIRGYLSMVPDMPMGNLVGFQWLETTEPNESRLRMLWCRGLGRWLLHHLHDLLSDEAIEGPNTLLVSATGWSGRSSLFNLNHSPDLLLTVTESASDRLAASKFYFSPVQAGHGTKPLRVSGAGQDADANLEILIDALFSVRGGLRDERRAWMDDILGRIAHTSRQRAMLVVNSTAQAKRVSERIGRVASARYRDGHVFVVPDGHGADRSFHFEQALPRGRVETFGRSDENVVLIVPMLSVERGLNILNDEANGACGAILFLTRPHPPASDPQLALSMLAGDALGEYGRVVANASDVIEERRALHHRFRRLYNRQLAQPMQYTALGREDRSAFVWNLAVRLWQTIGRGMRGGQPVDVYFLDAAFSPQQALGGTDTPHLSVLMAIQQELAAVCGGHPDPRWSARERTVAAAIWHPMLRCLEQMSDERRYMA